MALVLAAAVSAAQQEQRNLSTAMENPGPVEEPRLPDPPPRPAPTRYKPALLFAEWSDSEPLGPYETYDAFSHHMCGSKTCPEDHLMWTDCECIPLSSSRVIVTRSEYNQELATQLDRVEKLLCALGEDAYDHKETYHALCGE